jgi:antitoxin component YwqK of YwqJK toxin-antitoxin module
MKVSGVGSAIVLSALACGANVAVSQDLEKTEFNAARVTVSMNADGSRTVYQFDDAQHKAIATTTGQDGKLRQTIRYELDDAGRFSSGRISGPDGRIRFKSRYTYDNAGRLQEETQSAEDGSLLHKIVYSYDQNGKQTGYSIFDASGKLLGRITPLITAPSSSPKSREKSSR